MFLLSSLVTGPILMSISSLVLELLLLSFVRDWSEIRESEIPVWLFAEYLETGGSTDTKFGTDVSNEILLFAAKFQGYSFYRFRVIAFTFAISRLVRKRGVTFLWGRERVKYQ